MRLYIILCLFICSSCNQINEEQLNVSDLSQDVRSVLLQNLVLEEDQYRLNLSEQQANEKGISSMEYKTFVQMIEDSNNRMSFFKKQHPDYKVIFFDPSIVKERVQTKNEIYMYSASASFSENGSQHTGFTKVATVEHHYLDLEIRSGLIGVQSYTFFAYFVDDRSQQFPLVESGDGNGKPLLYYYDPLFGKDGIVASFYFDIPNVIGPNGESPYLEDGRTIPTLGILISRLSAQDARGYSSATVYLR